MIKVALRIAMVALPWPLKRCLLQKFFGYKLAPTARIGLSYIFPDKLEMADHAFIGHFNVAINLGWMCCGAYSRIGRSNWITGYPSSGRSFRQRMERQPTLTLGRHSAVTKSHILDCTDRIDIGEFTTIAGYGSQLITHGINLAGNYQDCQPIRIGSYCLVGTRVTIIGGAALPDYSVLAAASVLNKKHTAEFMLYAGQPASHCKALDEKAAYFHRERGFVE